MVECDLAKVEVAGSNPVFPLQYLNRRGPLHLRLARFHSAAPFAARSVPVAQLNYSTLSIAPIWRAVPRRDCAALRPRAQRPLRSARCCHRGPLHPAWLFALRRRFAAGSVPVAQLNYSTLSIVGWRAVPRRDCALRSVGPNAHSAPRAAVTRGPMHPAWLPSLRRRFAAGSVPVAQLNYSTLSIDRAGGPNRQLWDPASRLKTGLDRIGPPPVKM